jgi:hypothetical protein
MALARPWLSLTTATPQPRGLHAGQRPPWAIAKRSIRPLAPAPHPAPVARHRGFGTSATGLLCDEHTDTPQTRETTHAPHTHTHTHTHVHTHTARVMWSARQPGAAAGARSILASVEPLPRADSESVSMLEHAGADRPWTYGGAVLCGSDTTRTYGLGPGDGRTPRAGGSTVGHAAGCVQTACSWDLCRVAWRFLRADSPVIRRGVLHCAGRVSVST